MLSYLDDQHDFDPPFMDDGELRNRGMTILELGAGTGIVTSKISEILADVSRDVIICTDLPEVCPLLEANLNDLPPSAVRVRPLAWGDADHVTEIAKELSHSPAGQDIPTRYLSHIVCSDLVRRS